MSIIQATFLLIFIRQLCVSCEYSVQRCFLNKTLTPRSSRCSRRVSNSGESVSCPNNCVSDVVWCNENCRLLGQSRHEYECSWLKKHSQLILREAGEYDFSMLWLVVRILAERYLETQTAAVGEDLKIPLDDGSSQGFRHSWNEICKLRSNQGSISPEKSSIGLCSPKTIWGAIPCYQITPTLLAF